MSKNVNRSFLPDTYSELIQNKIFRRIAKICLNDSLYLGRGEKSDVPGSKYLWDIDYCLPYRLQLAYLVFAILQIHYLQWDLTEVVIPFFEISVNIYSVMFVAVYIITICAYLFNIFLSWKENIATSVINIILVFATWYGLKNGAPYFETYILSTAIQIGLITIHSTVLYIFSKKHYKKWGKFYATVEEENAEYENFYEETLKIIEDSWALNDYSLWWKMPKYKQSLVSGKKYKEKHSGLFKYSNTENYDYYDIIEKKQVKGSEITDYLKFYDKYYSISEVPAVDYFDVLNHIKRDGFKTIYPFNIDEAVKRECVILAVKCRCVLQHSFNRKRDEYVTSSPTQDQIDAARDSINEQYDNRERTHNLWESGLDYTTEQMIDAKGLTAEMWDESERSRNLRQSDLNNYINKNTHTTHDSNESHHGHSKEYSEIFMYIVDGCVFYNDKCEKLEKNETGVWASDLFEFDEHKSVNYYHTRQEEIEATIHYLMKNDLQFSQNLIVNTWKGRTELSAKIIHSFCNDNNRYFDK